MGNLKINCIGKFAIMNNFHSFKLYDLNTLFNYTHFDSMAKINIEFLKEKKPTRIFDFN